MTRLLLSGLCLGLVSLLQGCDNPACVFGGTCAGGTPSGAIGTEPASVPAEGEQILASGPTIVDFFPDGTAVDVQTPIVVVFSESMSPNNISFAFELRATTIGGGVPLQAATFIGDGHMAVLFPLTELQPSETYQVRFRDNVKLFDRTGQVVAQPADGIVGSFSTGAADPATPTVVATWPRTGTTNQSPTTEIDVVFSRAVQADTVGDPSWVVTVNGSPPAEDPAPQPITLSGVVTDTRAYRWRSTDASGGFVPLGINANVRLELSPVGQAITDEFGLAVPNTVVTFTTMPFEAPSTAAITSDPDDAIGINQLVGPADLAIEVGVGGMSGSLAGDRLGVFVFGTEPQTNPPQPVQNLRTIALQREVDLPAGATTFTMVAAELDLLKTTSPLAARFLDGKITFAFYIKRGAAVSPVKLLDVDASANGTQSPTLDTVAPTLLGLSTSGTTVSTFRSDARDVVLVGRASESLRAALVETASGNNEVTMGELPAVTGATSGGLFVAAPVRVGVLPSTAPTLSYTLTIYDSALNTATPVTGVFTQVGQASNGPRAGLFSNITVDVFNATTLAPVAGATVYVHENLLGSTVLVDSDSTDVDGRATLDPALLGESIVTVDATSLGFELFTFDGIPTSNVSIPLRPNTLAGATVSGSISTSDLNVGVYSKGVSDTRFNTPGETVLLAGSCSFSTQAQALLCNFPSTAIRAREIGAQSAVVVLEPTSPFLYSPLTFLKAFSLTLPMAPADPGTTQTNVLALGTSLDAGTLDPEERPIDVQPSVLSTVNWPALSGDPRVRVEATSPGMPHDLTVGRGIAFDDGLPPNTWAIRAAYPGSVDGIADVATDELGRFVKSQTVDPDLLLRVEVVDAAGNRGGVRPRLSVAALSLTPPPPPAPGPAPFTPNTDTLDFAFADVIPDAASEMGIYKVRLTDGAGFSWTVWRLDGRDSAGPDAVVHLPLIGPGGTLPLAAGDLSARISAFAWPTFDPLMFSWTDVEREFDLFAHTAPTTVTPP
jgi:hypothetical protein